MKHIQILSPMRKGPLGVGNLNKQLQSILNPKCHRKNEKEFRG
jgi:exodeoxyribonuclease V alpha subunit